MDSPVDRGRVFAAVLRHLTALPLPAAAWPMPAAWFEGPVSDPAALLHELRENHPIELLTACGVLQPGADGTLQLASELTASRLQFLVMRNTENLPFDLLSHHGVLGGAELPLFRIGAPSELFLAFSLVDVLVLRSWGLAATLATGLETLNADDVVRLCHLIDVTPPAQPASNVATEERSKPTTDTTPADGQEPEDELDDSPEDEAPACVESLHLVAWSPSTFSADVPYLVESVSALLYKIQKFQRVTLSEIGAWAPTDAEREEIEFLARRGDGVQLPAALAKSADEHSYDAVHWKFTNPPLPGPPETFLEARENLLAVLRSSKSVLEAIDKHRLAWRQFEELLEQEIIAPLIEKALEARHPEERNLRLALAELSREFHLGTARKHADGMRWNRLRGVPGVASPDKNEFRETLALCDKIRAITRELEKWKTRTVMPNSPRPKAPVVPCPGSVSVPATSAFSLAKVS